MANRTTLIIARHGNTFLPDETPRRVGARTDIDLVPSGLLQAEQLGQYLHQFHLRPDHIISAPLKRTRQTVTRAFPNRVFNIDERLREIDYGPDEGLEEDLVRARIGEQALHDWEHHATVPEGWQVDPATIITDWHDIAAETLNNRPSKITLIVTSNGTARFAPHITHDFDGFKRDFPLKLATGALGILTYQPESKAWRVQDWNIRPKDHITLNKETAAH